MDESTTLKVTFNKNGEKVYLDKDGNEIKADDVKVVLDKQGRKVFINKRQMQVQKVSMSAEQVMEMKKNKSNKILKKKVDKDGKVYFVDEHGQKVDSSDCFVQEIVDEHGNTIYVQKKPEIVQKK